VLFEQVFSAEVVAQGVVGVALGISEGEIHRVGPNFGPTLSLW
jgi:hypothetical protein